LKRARDQKSAAACEPSADAAHSGASNSNPGYQEGVLT
jgi:hypothetical protein